MNEAWKVASEEMYKAQAEQGGQPGGPAGGAQQGSNGTPGGSGNAEGAQGDYSGGDHGGGEVGGGGGNSGCTWEVITETVNSQGTDWDDEVDILEISCPPEIKTSTDCFETSGAYGINVYEYSLYRLKYEYNFNTEQLEWLKIEQNKVDQEFIEFLMKLYNYGISNELSEQAESFSLEAVDITIQDGEVDFEHRLINNPLLHDFLKDRMSSTELALFNTLTTVQKGLYLRAAAEAYAYTEIFYPQPVRNRKGDSVKHALWNALSTNYIGATLTKQLTDAHEEIAYDPDYLNHFKETNMDLFNNAKGRSLATQYGSLIFKLVEDALYNGELKYLNNLILMDGFYNATNDSQLIPTNQ